MTLDPPESPPGARPSVAATPSTGYDSSVSSSADRLLREVLASPAEERADLLRRLRQALPREPAIQDSDSPEDVRAAWVELALARLERHDRGESGATKTIDEVETLLVDSLREP
jgi:hypothetical protein